VIVIIERLAVVRCKECDGTGRNGRIGPYEVLCCACEGNGHIFKLFAAQS
jgi:DnaJ-class molecular chaperone